MSGFDRALGELSADEMLRCAGELLRYLSEGAAARPAGSEGERAEYGGGTRRGAGYGVPAGGKRARRGVYGADAARRTATGGVGTGGSGRERRVFAETEAAESPKAADAETEDAGRREQKGGFLGGIRERPSAADTDGGTHTAAFQGPERRYENAVGARGMEMSRVSDYFRRDSRRYDAGFTRF